MSLLTNTEILNYLQVAAGVTVPSAGQTFITLVQPMVEGAVKRAVGSDVEQATYTEYYPEAPSNAWSEGDELVTGYDLVGGVAQPIRRGGRERYSLLLRQIPVRSITSIIENPAAYYSSPANFTIAALPATAYYLDDVTGSGLCRTGKVYRNNGVWSSVPRTIQVVYVGGWTGGEITTYAPEVKLAALIAVAKFYQDAVVRARSANQGGVVSATSIRDFSVSYATQMSASGAYALPPECLQLLAKHVNVGAIFG